MTPARIAALARRFRLAKPFPHVIIDRFLDERFCASLLREFPPYDPAARLINDGKWERSDLRRLGPAFRRLDRFLRSAAFLEMIGRIAGVKGLRHDPGYHGAGTHELPHGTELPAHVDFNELPGKGWRRRVNFFLYLNPGWRSSWGGALELRSCALDRPGAQRTARILPKMNRCVVFQAGANAWHGVAPVDLPPGQRGHGRRSVAVYLYTEGRPAYSRPTVWAHLLLPGRLSAGQVLTKKEALALRRLGLEDPPRAGRPLSKMGLCALRRAAKAKLRRGQALHDRLVARHRAP